LKRHYPALADAADGAATPQIRNMATLGGNLCQRPRCWYYRLAEFDCRKKGGATCFAQDGENRFHAIFDSDLFCCCIHPSATAVALLAYGAKLETISPKGRRTIAMDDFFVRPTEDALRENVLAPGEIIQTVRIPAPAEGWRSVYRKLKEKESFDWPLVETCVNLAVSGGQVRLAQYRVQAAGQVRLHPVDGEDHADQRLSAGTGRAGQGRHRGVIVSFPCVIMATRSYGRPLTASCQVRPVGSTPCTLTRCSTRLVPW